jgi:cytochrome c556
MTRTVRFTLAAILVLAATTLPPVASAAPAPAADIVKTRVAGLRELGAAFKNAMDGLRGGEPQTIMIRQSAREIKSAAQAQYQWFPAGSGPQRGVKTLAKPEIWTKPAEFRAAQDNLAKQADAFQRAAMSGNADAMRASARSLGGACKGCHDQFRTPPKD